MIDHRFGVALLMVTGLIMAGPCPAFAADDDAPSRTLSSAAREHLALLLESAPATRINYLVESPAEGDRLIRLTVDSFFDKDLHALGGPERAALLAAGIIDSRSQYPYILHGFHPADDGMPPGHDEPEIGVCNFVFQMRRVEMSHHVIHTHPGLSCRPGQALGIGKADKKGSDESRTGCYRHSINIIFQGNSRLTQGARGHFINPFNMKSRGYFRNNTVPWSVPFNLSCHNI